MYESGTSPACSAFTAVLKISLMQRAPAGLEATNFETSFEFIKVTSSLPLYAALTVTWQSTVLENC